MTPSPQQSADDVFAFADEESPAGESTAHAPPVPGRPPWQVLVVDDDPQVQLVTRLAFTQLQLDGRSVLLHMASSASEARALLSSRDDIAAAIVDVVMESESAGLDLVKWIRQQPQHASARVILRTGQPGFAPEESVLRDYDINDYWPKTELTAHRMRTLLTGQLRSYRDLRLIERQRNDLSRVVGCVADLFTRPGLQALLSAIVSQVQGLLDVDNALLVVFDVRDAGRMDGIEVLATAGRAAEDSLPADVRALLGESRQRGRLVRDGDRLALFSGTGAAEGGRGVAFFASGVGPLEEWAIQTLELLTRNALSVLSSQLLYEEQRALLAAVERFVPDRLVRMAGADDVRQLKAGDHQRGRKWVLFADLRGFTTLSERLAPGEVHATLQEFFAAVTPVVERHAGVVDKFLGDGLMGLFPGDEPPPLQACHEMIAALDELNAVRRRRDQPALQLSMALHGGPVLLCVLGHDQRVEITAVSDTVNVASRLEQLTRVVGTSFVVSHAVYEGLSSTDQALLRPLGSASVRGRKGAIRIYDAARDATAAGHAPANRMEAVLVPLEAGAPGAREALQALAAEFPRDEAVSALLLRDWDRERPAAP